MSLNELPEGCIAKALSFTTPEDVCRLSAVSPVFKSAADSDDVWERFLPSDLESILSTFPVGPLLASGSSKKELYLRLCNNPVLVDHGRKSFSLEKKSGKKCYMLSARDLFIAWGGTPRYWRWNPDPDSRFPEVAELRSVWWLDIAGKINYSMLSSATWYTAYLVLKFSIDDYYGLDDHPVEVTMTLDGEEIWAQTVSWDAETRMGQELHNGWIEIELGDFFTMEGEDGELKIRVFDGPTRIKGGMIVEGIEIRPKQGATGASPSS